MNSILKIPNASVMSSSTDTSSDTATGLGTLSGRVVIGLGNAVLQGIDNLVIRRALGVIKSTFPHDDDSAPENIGTLYDNVLELSRIGMYSEHIREQALRLLLIQINNRQTLYLIQRLVLWPLVEKMGFLSEFMACMPPEWLLPCNSSSSTQGRGLLYSDVFHRGSHPPNYSALSIVKFVRRLVKTDSSTCQVVVQAGFLDMLLGMYVCNFSSGGAALVGIHDVLRPEILTCGCSILVLLSQLPDIRISIKEHPVSVLWPKHDALVTLYGDQTANRPMVWPRLGSAVGAQRLLSLGAVLRPSMRWKNGDAAELVDAFVDLVELSKEDLFGPEVAHKSQTLLRKFNWDTLRALYLDMLSITTSDSAGHCTTEDVITAASRLPVTSDKLRELLDCGPPLSDIDLVDARYSPWYLRSSYGRNEILFHADGSVKGGTVAALVTRLTSHEYADLTFNQIFMTTWRSFVDADALFNLLVRQFYMQPPDNLTQEELHKWKQLKQHVVQTRVLNTLRSMISNQDVLDTEFVHCIHDFITRDEVYDFAAAKVLLTLLERHARWGKNVQTQSMPVLAIPPASIPLKSSSNLGLLSIDALELARQLTILESRLYMKIKPVECLQRASDAQTDCEDNISSVTGQFNRLENWVQDNVLRFGTDTRMGANFIKYVITVAHHCRGMHNFSSMVAIVSALNVVRVRGLKHTWENVPARFMRQLTECEAMFDPPKKFTTYRRVLGATSPPCVPYFGVFLAMLNLIQKGSRDTLPGNLVNFRKRRKVAEIINDVKRWQLQPHYFHPIQSVLDLIEESMKSCSKQPYMGERVWNSNLQRDLRRNEEEMIRSLQESGI